MEGQGCRFEEVQTTEAFEGIEVSRENGFSDISNLSVYSCRFSIAPADG